MQHRGRRNALLRRHGRVIANESEVVEHRVVVGEAHLPSDVHGMRLRRDALESHAAVFLDDLDAIEAAEEVEMPEGPAELAIRDRLQPDSFLLGDDAGDLDILDRAQSGSIDLTAGEALAGVVNGCWTQQAADLVGAEGDRMGCSHGDSSIRCNGLRRGVRAAQRTACTSLNSVARPRIYTLTFSSILPLYVQKVERKGRSADEVYHVISWLTGYDRAAIDTAAASEIDLEAFFAQAPILNPNAALITGVVCGVRVEEIEDPVVQRIRYLDKLVDELARGKKITSILRTPPDSTGSRMSESRATA